MATQSELLNEIRRIDPDYKENAERDLVYDNLADVQLEHVDWLWHGKIAYEMITLLAGDPGVGKSTLLAYIASVVSRGGVFHGQSDSVNPQRVLFILSEDSVSKTLKARLIAAGADLSMIDAIRGFPQYDARGNLYYEPISLDSDLGELDDLVQQRQYGLIIVDPITPFLGAVDEYNNKQIRKFLAQFTALLERQKAAALFNTHFGKQSTSNLKTAAHRVLGSTGLVATVRLNFGVVIHPECPEKRVFFDIKNNLAEKDAGLVYTLTNVHVANCIKDVPTSKVTWLDEYYTGDLNSTATVEPEAPANVDRAVAFLLEKLQYGGRLYKELRDEGMQCNPKIYQRDLEAAKNRLNLYTYKPFMNSKAIGWALPAD